MKFLYAVAGGLDQRKNFFLLSSFLHMWCGGFTVEFLLCSWRGGPGPGLEWACGGLVVGFGGLWWAFGGLSVGFGGLLVGFWWASVGFGELRRACGGLVVGFGGLRWALVGFGGLRWALVGFGELRWASTGCSGP